MGYTPYAKAIIGYRIPLSHFTETRKVKTFEHSYPEDWTHDPKSGKPLWETETYYTKGMPEDEPYLEEWEGFVAHVHKLHYDEDHYVFIGVARADTSGYSNWVDGTSLDLDTLKPMADKIAEKLKEFGLPANDFGLWCILS